ncbi:MAG: TPM domain-containing protein, partial [Bacteroidota bacterium]
MRSLLYTKVFIVSLWLFPFISFAQSAYTIESVPNPKNGGTGYVSDPDDILSSADELRLNQLIAEMEDSTTAQVAVVIVQSIGTTNPKFFTTELFNHWGIGQADVDNGLLVFTVMDQRRTEFETGYGLEGVLPDVVCYRIGMQELVPEFKLGNYGQGLIKAVEAIKLNLEDPDAAAEISSNRRPSYVSGSRNRTDPLLGLFLTYLGIASLISLIMWIMAEKVLLGKEELYDKYHRLKDYYWGFLAFIFPLPYAFLYFYLKNRLKKLRTQPRYSRETGTPLILLSEEEEDAYLKNGQITEEEIGSVDYDVW